MKQLNRILVALMVSLGLSIAHAQSLPQSPVSYTTSGDSLMIAGNAIENLIGMRVEFDKSINTLKPIKGRYVGGTAERFLDDFAKANKFIWDRQGNTIIFAPEGTVITPKAGKPAPTSFSKVLLDPKDPNKYGLMIFQVHNAQVDDRRVGGNVPKVIPGVATLFRQFIGVPQPVAKQAPAPAQNNPQNPPATNSGQVQQVSLANLFIKGAPPVAEGSADNVSFMGNETTRGVYADSRLNAILVRDKIANFESYKKIVELLDRPAEMVQMEAFVVDIRKDKVRELGVNLGLSPESLSSNLILNGFSWRKLMSQIAGMEGEGTAETLSVPSVVSLNNEQALFSSRQNFFISVAGAYNATVNQVTAETQLMVTPQIANESPDVPFDQRRIKLLINVQDAQANATTATNSSNLLVAQSSTTTLPSTTENQINTQAVVRSGDSLVIGGQVTRKKLTKRDGIPTGGILGSLFSKNTDEFHDYVRVYIVRPKILGEDSVSANSAFSDTPVTRTAKQTLDNY